MSTLTERLAALGTAIPEIRLPAAGVDLAAWAVIACDQYTQDRAYWQRVEERVGDLPSALRLVLPEIYLEDGDRPERIAGIRRAMAGYLDKGILGGSLRGAVYIERDTPHHAGRRGLVLAVDLERYEWAPAARPLIRATEGTVRERLPPRMEIRRAAPLESPHILLLIDDDERGLIEGLGDTAKARPGLYEVELMEGAGRLRAWAIDREDDWERLAAGLERLASRAAGRYHSAPDETPFLYAVGDGNHSLATAKAVWDEYKRDHAGEPGIASHPARFALVEVENIYDPAIEFEPIHRALFGSSAASVEAALQALPGFRVRDIASLDELKLLMRRTGVPHAFYGLVWAGGQRLIETAAAGVATEALQPLLDRFVAAGNGRSIDYLHGDDETIRVARSAPSAVGLLLPPVGKADLFPTVARSGPLPRKSFSMGEAVEKRFYLECRRLFG